MPYRYPIVEVNISRATAAALVSSQLRAQADIDVVAALLEVAAGNLVSSRMITDRQYQLLAAHRVLSLVPNSWTHTSNHDVRSDRKQIAAEQLLLVARATTVLKQLTSVGIDVRVLKGMATSELDYPDPAMRTSGDVDLLVRPQDFECALQSIERLGFECPPPGRFGYEFQQEATLTNTSGVEIDVHFRLTRTAAAPGDLLKDRVRLETCGGYAMPAELRLMHAASHLLFSAPGARRISGLADISAIRARHEIDLQKVRRHAASMGCEALVGASLRIERNLRGLPSDTQAWTSPSWLERSSFARGNRHLLMEHVLCGWALHGWSERARYLADWALPTSGAVAKRGGALAYFRRALPRKLGGQTGGQEI